MAFHTRYAQVLVLGAAVACGPIVDSPSGSSSESGETGASSTSSASTSSAESGTSGPPSTTGPGTVTISTTATASATATASDTDLSTSSDGSETTFDPCGDFIGCIDIGGTDITPCHPFDDPDCGEGEKCTYDYHPKGGSFACGDISGDGEQFDPCETTFEPTDTCAEGFTCQTVGTCPNGGPCCLQFCDPFGGDPTCADPGLTCMGRFFYDENIGICV